MKSARSVLAASVVAVVTLAACGSENAQEIPTTTSTTATSTPNEQVILQDYRSFWDDYLAVTNPMTPGNPRIAAHTTADEHAALNGIVVAGNAKGTVFKGSFELAPKVLNANATTAAVSDCYIDRTGEYSVSTGQRLDKPDDSRRNITATMNLVGGVWKVASIDKKSAPCTP